MTDTAGQTPRYRYLLELDVPATEAAVLRDALDGEELGLRDRLGAARLAEQIDALRIEVDEGSAERWEDFDVDLGVLSLYLTSIVQGHEIETVAGRPPVAWRITARRGEVVRVKHHMHRDEADGALVIGEADVPDARKRWADFPDWIKNQLRAAHPELGER